MSDTIEILNERVFPVDRATLFDAFADPEKLGQWWGPDGFTNHISAFDLRPGGSWLITMTAENGINYHNHWTFEDIVLGEIITARHHEPVHVFTLDMRFSDAGQGARLSWRMIFDRTAENEAMEKFMHAANEQNFDRLARLLAQRKGDH